MVGVGVPVPVGVGVGTIEEVLNFKVKSGSDSTKIFFLPFLLDE